MLWVLWINAPVETVILKNKTSLIRIRNRNKSSKELTGPEIIWTSS